MSVIKKDAYGSGITGCSEKETKKQKKIIIISSQISIRTRDTFGSGMVQKRLFVPHIKIEIKKTQRKRSPWGGDPPVLSN